MLKSPYSKAFTIVELLIVVIVIAILATIVTIAYNGITQRAIESVLKSDTESAAKAMMSYKIAHGEVLPGDCLDAGVVVGGENNITCDTSAGAFCVSASRGDVSFYATQDQLNPAKGSCSGATGVPYVGYVPAGDTWTGHTASTGGGSAASQLASSVDGSKLVISVVGGYLYTSSDSGATWTERTSAGSRQWESVTSSSDGSKLAATVNGGYIYTSSDSGATWTERTSAGSRQWRGITSSSDGSKLIAAVYGNYIYTSSDYGATWVARTGSGARYWDSVASSSDGNKLIAAIFSSGYIYFIG